MTRFVELPIVSDRGSTIWVNPDHVVAVEASHQADLGRCWLMTEMGCRIHVALSQEGAVECLTLGGEYLTGYQSVDLRDSVRENLQR